MYNNRNDRNNGADEIMRRLMEITNRGITDNLSVEDMQRGRQSIHGVPEDKELYRNGNNLRPIPRTENNASNNMRTNRQNNTMQNDTMQNGRNNMTQNDRMQNNRGGMMQEGMMQNDRNGMMQNDMMQNRTMQNDRNNMMQEDMMQNDRGGMMRNRTMQNGMMGSRMVQDENMPEERPNMDKCPPCKNHDGNSKPTDFCKKMRPGYAYVKPQDFDELYEPSKALKRGTMFRVLDLPKNVYEMKEED